jgi:hypothetical protein
MAPADVDVLSAAARAWFVANQQGFAGRLQNALESLLIAQPVDAE